MSLNTIYNEDCRETLRRIPDNSVDLMVTDPPYGISFMGKAWDRALPDKRIWFECLRVLKDGAFAFVMSIPRADCLSRMIISLEDAGFRVNFTPIFWAQAQGFPKAQNIGKAVDKRLGVERKIAGIKQYADGKPRPNIQSTEGCNDGWKRPSHTENYSKESRVVDIPATPQAKALDGSYGGWQPKPAVEVIIVAMKPLSEKTYVDQALKNRHGITWLDEGRIPYDGENNFGSRHNSEVTEWKGGKSFIHKDEILFANPQGRFPANLSVSDDVLNDGRNSLGSHSQKFEGKAESIFGVSGNQLGGVEGYGDSGSFSRYFDLDKWWEERIKQLPGSVQKTFPFLIVPKASKSEKNKGCEDLELKESQVSQIAVDSFKCKTCGGWIRPNPNMDNRPNSRCFCDKPIPSEIKTQNKKVHNFHPTVKPLKLMSYLVTLGSREGDLVLDPFIGSGTTAVACINTKRNYIGCELNKDYYDIAVNRISNCQKVII